MLIQLPADQLYFLAQQFAVVDLRAPAEFASGHIPGAHSIPLFSDEQRMIVGILYKQQGKDAAIAEGLKFVGQKLNELLAAIIVVTRNKTVIVHCWRGGMRSKSVAALLDSLGYTVYILAGGYKAFRAYHRSLFAQPWQLKVLSGKTGSGKTELLKMLTSKGEQVVDLEGLANHKGSVLGALGQLPQPTQEHFENLLGWQMQGLDRSKRVWIEDESQSIGLCIIPNELWNSMRVAPVIRIDVPYEQRRAALLAEYGIFSVQDLDACITKLEKYIGNERARKLRANIANPDACIDDVLAYYDKTYTGGFERRVATIAVTHVKLNRPFTQTDITLLRSL